MALSKFRIAQSYHSTYHNLYHFHFYGNRSKKTKPKGVLPRNDQYTSAMLTNIFNSWNFSLENIKHYHSSVHISYKSTISQILFNKLFIFYRQCEFFANSYVSEKSSGNPSLPIFIFFHDIQHNPESNISILYFALSLFLINAKKFKKPLNSSNDCCIQILLTIIKKKTRTHLHLCICLKFHEKSRKNVTKTFIKWKKKQTLTCKKELLFHRLHCPVLNKGDNIAKYLSRSTTSYT